MKETQCFIEVPLADELFECLQGPFQSSVEIGDRQYQYHTYANAVIGNLDDTDGIATLRLAFQGYLGRLRENCANLPGLDWPLGQIYRPTLYWRFQKGSHIALEWNGKKGQNSRIKLRTRLVVPACTLVLCSTCLHTEGEPHGPGCENIVRKGDFQLPVGDENAQ